MKKPMFENKHRGQSFVEMAFIIPILLIVLLGMTEIVFAFSAYLQVTDASRNSARFAANNHPYPDNFPDPGPNFYNVSSAYDRIPECRQTLNFFRVAACEAAFNLRPIVMDDSTSDQHIIISVFRTQDNDEETNSILYRFDDNGVNAEGPHMVEDSDCATDGTNCGVAFLCSTTDASDLNWTCKNGHNGASTAGLVSRFPTLEVTNRLLTESEIASEIIANPSSLSMDGEGNAFTRAPSAGFILVEIIHQHQLILNVPIISNFIGENIEFYAFEFMPVARAERAEPPAP